MSSPADLITQTFLLGFLSDLNLTAAQLAKLPDFTSSASQAIRRHCNRIFTSYQFDEVYTVQPPETRVTLRQFPIISVDRCMTNPAPLLTVWCTDSYATRASVSLATTGDMASGFTVTGLALSRWSSGSRVNTSVAFTANMTAAQLATAVTVADSAWQAQAASGYALAPVSDLRPPQGPIPALGSNAAKLLVHAEDLECFPDERLGYLDLAQPDYSATDSPRWGPTWSSAVNDVLTYGGRNGLRVVYTAGFATVPSDVQQYTAEVVKAALNRFNTDAALKSESDGVLSWSARDELLPIPREVQVGLAPWVNRRAG